MQISVKVNDNFYLTPPKHHVMFLASKRILQGYDVVVWYNYMSTVKDLLSAGF